MHTSAGCVVPVHISLVGQRTSKSLYAVQLDHIYSDELMCELRTGHALMPVKYMVMLLMKSRMGIKVS